MGHGGPGRLIIVCGLPGAGKTTHALHLERTAGAVRLCPDEWMTALAIDLWAEAARERVEKLQWSLGKRLLALGNTVVVEWGTWGRSERDALRTDGRALGAAVELHYLSAPVDVLYERVRQRGSEDPPMTMDDMVRYARLIQVRTTDELALYDDEPSS